MQQQLKRITYVEDDPDIRAIAELALGSLGGFAIDLCASGQEALEKVPQFAPDLILMDVMMPGMDGTETFEKLKKDPASANIPVVFLTAKAQRHEVKEYRDNGAIDVIIKPFDPIELPYKVSCIWQNYLGEERATG
ncbi:Response regulator receiver domain-containing protein [Cohaesibacter sp. ES.047]|uniref:response regulator n=1 Tax=Cohaesibacter sp. ES.047 TaxID=1798205 RepID=UPI000BB72415|nr:response regulator [Cohaesibacter sp. ES.047]SNY91331.1 Response regulator receiver domain-containing protein [Cohaesibacter sp. ES.047]